MDKVMYDETYMSSNDFKNTNPYQREKTIPLSTRYREMRIKQTSQNNNEVPFDSNTNGDSHTTIDDGGLNKIENETDLSEPIVERPKSNKIELNNNIQLKPDNLNNNNNSNIQKSFFIERKPYFLKSNDLDDNNNSNGTNNNNNSNITTYQYYTDDFKNDSSINDKKASLNRLNKFIQSVNVDNETYRTSDSVREIMKYV